MGIHFSSSWIHFPLKERLLDADFFYIHFIYLFLITFCIYLVPLYFTQTNWPQVFYNGKTNSYQSKISRQESNTNERFSFEPSNYYHKRT